MKKSVQYNPKKIEKKWQKYWETNKTFEVTEDKTKDKFYSLIEFPYPSGEGLHVGHPRPFTAMDVVSRKKRMEGKNVLFPIGFDSFGLPTENYAIKTGQPPAKVTKKNIANFTRQLKMLGYSFDWSRVVDTSDPKYYKWTQWLFLQFFKHGLAYKKNQPINWCPKDKIGLANEEVVNGCCERCGTAVEKRNKEQWMLAITKYADKLLDGLNDVDYIDRARVQQENWIGKSEGAEIVFPLRMIPGQSDDKHSVKVFTTRPDTIFGATFIAISPELAKKWLEVGWQTNDKVKKYIEETILLRAAVTDREEKAKTGIDTGIKAVNPVNNQEVPVWITNYVLGDFGTGAIMGVPAHDERDGDFAKKFDLPITEVIQLKENKTKHLIFDFDGVIGDTWEAGIETRIKMGDVKNREEAIEANNLYFNRKPVHTKNHNLTEEEMKGLHLWMQRYGEIMAKTTFPLFDAFISEIKKIPNTKIAVISAGSGLYMRERSANSGLNPTHVLSFEDHHSKEEKIEQVCKDWGVNIKDIYYFTDSKADVYELEGCMDQKKLIGCAWGYCGYDALRELLPENQVLKEAKDISKLFAQEKLVEKEVMVNSDFLNGLSVTEAKEKVISWLKEKSFGKGQTQYKLRDWVFSRQRYWGEPIPLVFCENCKNKKQKVLMIHGFESSGDNIWFPWMKSELEKNGYEVFAPTVRNPNHGSVKDWVADLLPYMEQLDENDVIIGHSLGSKAALHLLEKTGKKIGHLYLVASAIGTIQNRDWDELRAKWPKSDIDSLQAFWHAPVDYKKISKLVRSINLIRSSDDKNIPASTHTDLPPGWLVQTWNGFGHFMHLEIPELLREILTSKNTGWIPLPESELPLKLPKVEKYQPTDNGESPLAAMEKWVNTKCPQCGGSAKRETDTMPNWAGSSWYSLRYADPHNDQEFASQEKLNYWAPVDWYNGGMEHVVLHLLYSRFWNIFLHDIGLVPHSEPYAKRTAHGMILAKGGEKMSKSKGNVINPDDMVEQFGADALRTYIMFMGPFDQAVEWDINGLIGVKRFLDKVWNLQSKIAKENEKSSTVSLIAKATKKVTDCIDMMKFNTAVSALMELSNELYKEEKIDLYAYQNFIKLLSPFAPHLAQELWEKFGDKNELVFSSWPKYHEEDLKEETLTLAVQINGKLRDTILVSAEISEDEAKKIALASEKVQKWLEGKEPKKVIYVKGKLVSIVV
ncbi:MAG TPA: alpha/beta fold hydrolase [Candidatus Udaeobacter sp.]|nr:alpha/beta fold hydrolase [Candidatus Udaeobacter sp.]